MIGQVQLMFTCSLAHTEAQGYLIMRGWYLRITIRVFQLICCGRLIVGMGWIEVAYADHHEYAIELHSLSGEKLVGETDLEIKKNSHTVNPVTKENFEGVLYSFQSRFKQTAGVHYESVAQESISTDFFQTNLIEHVWQRLGSGDLELDEYYYARKVQYTYPRQHTSMRPVCCGLYRQGESITEFEPRSMAQVIMQHIFRSVSVVPGTESTLQEWVVNDMGAGTTEDGFKSFDGYLRQKAPYASVTTLSEMKPFERQKWNSSRTILTPFAHTQAGLNRHDQLAESVSKNCGVYRKFLFPMDWKRAAQSKGADVSVSIKIQGEVLQLYERRKAGQLAKQRKANLYQRYDFEPQEGSLDLSIWAVPGSFVPVAWEYREVARVARAIRYVKVLSGEEENSVVTVGGQQIQVELSDVVRFKPPDHITHRPLPIIPERANAAGVIYNTPRETQFANLPLVYLLLVVPVFGKASFMNPIHPRGMPSVLSY